MENVKEIIIVKNDGEKIVIDEETSRSVIEANIPNKVRMILYRDQELEFRIEDAKRHYENFDPENKNDLTLDDFINMADMFLESYDCDTTENELWDYVISDYLGE